MEAGAMMKRATSGPRKYGSDLRTHSHAASLIFFFASLLFYISTFLFVDIFAIGGCGLLVQLITTDGWGWRFRLYALAWMAINLGFAVAFVGQWNIYFSPAATAVQGSDAHRLGRWRPVFATLVFAGILLSHSVLFMFMIIVAAFLSW
jgi:hypothetical protein